MIYAFSYTCERDRELSELMTETLIKQSAGLLSAIQITVTGGREFPDYGNGAGWNASMMKLSGLVKLLETHDIQNDDWVLSVDSDVVFTSPEVFSFLDLQYGIMGIQHQQPWKTHFGPWGHMSGCLIFIRGEIAKRMVDLTDRELKEIRFNHFKPFEITENEDVVLSYLAKYLGAKEFGLPGDLTSGDFENNIKNVIQKNKLKAMPVCNPEMANITHKRLKELDSLKSFYHLNYCPTSFLGEKVDGKWDIPAVLKKKGIEL